MTLDLSTSDPSNQSEHKPVILIVDDSRVMRVSLKKILANEFTIIEATDGEDGWSKLLADDNIQVVFSDLSMPHLDGFGLLARIRSNEDKRISDIPFIVITGNEDDDGIRKKALDCGATDLVIKPFQSLEITARAKAHANSQAKITEVENTLQEQSSTDSLTGLLNKKAFSSQAQKDLSFTIRHKNELALMLLAIDHYSAVTQALSNDQIGDILLTVTGILRAHTRGEDTLAHFGDGKFALLLPTANAVGAKHLGKRMLADIAAKKFSVGDSTTSITASIGIAAPPIKAGSNIKDIYLLAERRLKFATGKGGDTVISEDVAKAHESISDSQSASKAIEQELQKKLAAQASKIAQLEETLLNTNQAFNQKEQEFKGRFQKALQAKQKSDQAVKILEAEVDALRARVESEEQAHQSSVAADNERARGEQQEIQRLQQQISTLQANLLAMRNRAEAAELAHHNLAREQASQSKVDQELEQKHKEESALLRYEIEDLKNRLESAELAKQASSQTNKSMRNKFEELKSQFGEKLRQEQQHRERLIAEASKLKKELADVKAQSAQDTTKASASHRSNPKAVITPTHTKTAAAAASTIKPDYQTKHQIMDDKEAYEAIESDYYQHPASTLPTRELAARADEKIERYIQVIPTLNPPITTPKSAPAPSISDELYNHVESIEIGAVENTEAKIKPEDLDLPFSSLADGDRHASSGEDHKKRRPERLEATHYASDVRSSNWMKMSLIFGALLVMAAVGLYFTGMLKGMEFNMAGQKETTPTATVSSKPQPVPAKKTAESRERGAKAQPKVNQPRAAQPAVTSASKVDSKPSVKPADPEFVEKVTEAETMLKQEAQSEFQDKKAQEISDAPPATGGNVETSGTANHASTLNASNSGELVTPQNDVQTHAVPNVANEPVVPTTLQIPDEITDPVAEPLNKASNSVNSGAATTTSAETTSTSPAMVNTEYNNASTATPVDAGVTSTQEEIPVIP